MLVILGLKLTYIVCCCTGSRTS